MFAPLQGSKGLDRVVNHSRHFLKATSSVLLPQSSGCIKDDLKNQAPAAAQLCVDLGLSENHVSCTVKGQSRSDSLFLSPYHWAKLFRGVVAIVAVPMRFPVIC